MLTTELGIDKKIIVIRIRIVRKVDNGSKNDGYILDNN